MNIIKSDIKNENILLAWSFCEMMPSFSIWEWNIKLISWSIGENSRDNEIYQQINYELIPSVTEHTANVHDDLLVFTGSYSLQKKESPFSWSSIVFLEFW